MYESGNGQLQVRAGGKSKGIAHLRYAVTLLAVEGNIPEVGILFAMPYTDKRQTRVQPVLYLKRYRSLYASLLPVVEIQILVYLYQALRGLIKSLHRVIFGVTEPSTEDIFVLQDIVRLELVVLCRLQQGIAVDFGIPATKIGHGILHSPILGVILVAAQGKLQDVSGGRHVIQVDDGIPIPLVPDGRLITFYRQRSIQREFVAEILAETGIDVQRFFPLAGLHVIGQRTPRFFCKRRPISSLHPLLFILIVILITVVDTGGIYNTVIHRPPFMQTVFLCQEHFPAVDALAILRKKAEFVGFEQAAVEQLVGRRTVVSKLHTCFQPERSAVVQAAVVQPAGTVAQSRGLLRTGDLHPVVVGVVVTVVNKAQPVVLRDIVIGSHPETMRVRTAAPHLVGRHRVRRTVRQSVHSLLVRSIVRTAVFVRVKKIYREFILIVQHAGALLEILVILLAVSRIKLTLPRRRGIRCLFQLYIDKRTAHLVAGGRIVHHLGIPYPACGNTFQQCVQLSCAQRGRLSVQDNGNVLPRQLQRAVHFGYAGKLLYGIIGIVYGQVVDKPRQIVHELALRGFHHRTFTGNHHFGQALVNTVQPGIRGYNTVGTKGTFSAGVFLGGNTGIQKADD